MYISDCSFFALNFEIASCESASNIISLPFSPSLSLSYSWTVYNSICASINKKNTLDRPQNGSSFTGSSSSRHISSRRSRRISTGTYIHIQGGMLYTFGIAVVCVWVRIERCSRARSLYTASFAMCNKLVTCARIMPSYWKWNNTRRAMVGKETRELRLLMDPGNCLGEWTTHSEMKREKEKERERQRQRMDYTKGNMREKERKRVTWNGSYYKRHGWTSDPSFRKWLEASGLATSCDGTAAVLAAKTLLTKWSHQEVRSA